MATATITSKGQITIPSAIREDLHVVPGDRIEFVKVSDGRYEVVAATKEITSLKGMIRSNKVVSVEDMNRAIKAKAGR
ncbi:MAG: AbrB/MazE/SpoVT family DNA-binding domain-containing protein [Hahellaceae bacterium]|nr:AbrB/MazE/SpoVT family DNA-binding domain-containing protein [Hahellaceae bacterium]